MSSTPSYLKALYNKLRADANGNVSYNPNLPNDVTSWLDYSGVSDVGHTASDYGAAQDTFNALPLDNRLNIYNDYMMYDNGYMYEGYIGDGMSVDDYQHNIIADPEMYDTYVKYWLGQAK